MNQPQANAVVSLLPQDSDWLGNRGPHKSEFWTSSFTGEIKYLPIDDPDLLLRATEYGRYLESVGYEFGVVQECDFTLRLWWYIDPGEKVFGIKLESERTPIMDERVFAIKVPRKLVRSYPAHNRLYGPDSAMSALCDEARKCVDALAQEIRKGA